MNENVLASPAAPAAQEQPARPNLVTPMLFVGIRSMTASESDAGPFNFFSNLLPALFPLVQPVAATSPTVAPPTSEQPGATAAPTAVATPAEPADVEMADVEMVSPNAASRPAEPTSPSQGTPSETLNSAPHAPQPPRETQWVMFMSAGYYPANSSMQQYPFLLSALENASYEDFLRLAELLGSAKASTVSKEQLQESGLTLLNGAGELKRAEADGRVLVNTTERCLICLDDYQEEEQVRLLSCKHAFHQ
jgi:hypothetical protein